MNLKEYVTHWYIQKEQASNKVSYCQIHLTERCQYKCAHCYFAELGTNARDMTYPQLKNIVNEVVLAARTRGLYPRIDFTGGDPFLFSSLVDVLEHCSNLKVVCGLKCNPDFILSDDLRIEEILEKCDSVSLSLDGPPDFQDKLRGSGSFAKVTLAAKRVKAYGVRVRLSSTVSKDNQYLIVPLLEHLASLNISVDAYTWARYWSYANASSVISNLEMEQLFEECTVFLKEYFAQESSYCMSSVSNQLVPKISFAFKEHLWFPYLHKQGLIDDAYAREFITIPNSLNCSARRNTLVVDVDGSITKCRKMSTKISSVAGIFGMNAQESAYSSACEKCMYVNVCYGCPAVDSILQEDCRFFTPYT